MGPGNGLGLTCIPKVSGVRVVRKCKLVEPHFSQVLGAGYHVSLAQIITNIVVKEDSTAKAGL